MGERGKFISSLLKFSIGAWLSALIKFVAIPLTSRLYSPVDYGKAAFVNIVVDVFSTIIILGCDQSMVRYFHDSEIEENKLFQNIMVLVFIGWAIITIPIIIAGQVCFSENYSYLFNINILVCVLILILTRSFLKLSNLVYRMKKATFAYNVQTVVTTLSATFFVIIFGLIRPTFSGFIYANVLGSVIAVFLFVYFQRKWFVIKKNNINGKYINKALRYGLPFLPAFLLVLANNSISTVLLERYCGYKDVGLYSMALGVASMFAVFQIGFSSYWVPYAYEKYHNGQFDFSSIARLISLSLSLALIVLIFCKPLIEILLGVKFVAVADYYAILMIQPYVFSISEITVLGINVSKKTKYHLYISAAVLSTNVFVFWVLAEYGIVAMCVANAAAQIVFFATRSFFGLRLLRTCNNCTILIMSCNICIILLLATLNMFVSSMTVLVVVYIVSLVCCYVVNKSQIQEFYVLACNFLKMQNKSQGGVV